MFFRLNQRVSTLICFQQGCPPEEQQEKLFTERKELETVLKDVMNFQFRLPVDHLQKVQSSDLTLTRGQSSDPTFNQTLEKENNKGSLSRESSSEPALSKTSQDFKGQALNSRLRGEVPGSATSLQSQGSDNAFFSSRATTNSSSGTLESEGYVTQDSSHSLAQGIQDISLMQTARVEGEVDRNNSSINVTERGRETDHDFSSNISRRTGEREFDSNNSSSDISREKEGSGDFMRTKENVADFMRTKVGVAVQVSDSLSSGEATPTARNSSGDMRGGVGGEREGSSSLLNDSVSASFHDVVLTTDMVHLMQEALIQVQV